MKLGGRKLALGGFIVVLLIGIPLSIFLLQKQQETRSRAEKSTNIAFSPTSSQTAPIQKNVGDSIPLDITVDPGKNLVSFVKLEIQYDPDKLATDSANAFQANTVAFPSVLEGPVYSPGKISVTLSVGPDPTKAIQTSVKAATITFKAVANTAAGTPTLVTYGASTQVLSIGSSDQASENVLSAAAPAAITIGGTAVPSGPTQTIPTGTPSPTPDVTPTAGSLSPTTGPGGGASTTPATTPTTAPTGTVGTSTPPTCNSLSMDRSGSGPAPLSLTFTANGTSTGATISKVTFNFGDGQVSDVTQAGGIGTASVNAQISHTFNNTGSYLATAILTDSKGNVSTTDNCKQTISVQAASSNGGSGGGTGGGAVPTPIIVANGSPTPTMAATGSVATTIGIGAAAVLLIIGGGLLFFVL